MSGDQSVADAELVSKFFAKRVVKSAKKGAVDEAELAARIQEIELETQILGASFLSVHIIDPELTLTNSGWLEVREGLLDTIEVEFPEGSKWMWTLCACEISTQVGANLEVRFESSLVKKMREYWGPKQAPPGTRTRAQFVLDLLSEAHIPSVIPGLTKAQPLEEEEKGESGTIQVRSGIEKQKLEERVNKTRGGGRGAYKIEGAEPTAQQIADVNTALKVAAQHRAPPAAVEALIVAGITESGFKREASENNNPSNPHKGIWQSDVIPPEEVARQAEHFLIGGESFAAGGAIERAKKGIPPARIAVEVEVGGSESRNEAALPEARVIIQASGGVSLGGSPEAPATGESDVAQLTRGTPGNPDEDTFEAITRIASQVDWFAFTHQVPGQPEVMFYEDGPELARQKPAAYIDIQENYLIDAHTGRKEYGVVLTPTVGTIDNTTYEYRRTHKVKTRVQRRSKASKPSTPSEVRLDLVCAIDDYRSGDVFVIRGFGPCNGRWIISDSTRHCLKDTFTKFILEPPVEPLPEPLATAKGAELTGEAAPNNATPPGLTTPKASWNPNNKPICVWIEPILEWASQHGWKGVVVSGYRTNAEQEAAATHYASELGKTVAEIYPDGPLASNHCKTEYPGGAVDVSPGGPELANILKSYPNKPSLVWGGTTIEDAVHYSSNGH